MTTNYKNMYNSTKKNNNYITIYKRLLLTSHWTNVGSTIFSSVLSYVPCHEDASLIRTLQCGPNCVRISRFHSIRFLKKNFMNYK